ncbi:coiled-coil domain-containing protein [Oopsacas minuta]|uniref:Coiled-coil domain-containing protein n=1 Tax=Oopsacas minuta TaxID=111878 RepID=A0AAV7KAX8_9METZ|nr:coiled-coil domain-containing protein [Oopsacas minuta]
MSAAQIKSLKSDLSSLQELIPELCQTAKTTAPNINQCPSRLYPTKLARDIIPTADTEYVGLLELTIDRLQYLIQCVVCILGSQSPPLSLLSAVKKLSSQLTSRDSTQSLSDNPISYPQANNSTYKCVASQTYETSFTNCMNCIELQDVLLHVACLFTEGLQPLGCESRVDQCVLSSLDLDASDLLPPRKWAGPMEEDVKSFSTHLINIQKRANELEKNVRELSERLFDKSSEIRELLTQLSSVKSESVKSADQMRNEMEQEREERKRETHSISVGREQERIRADKLQHEISCLRQDLSCKSATMLNTETRVRDSESALKRIQAENTASIDKVISLEKELQESERGRIDTQADLEAKTVTVKKLEVQASSLRQHETKLQNKCDSLLGQVLSMEEELCRSQQDLTESVREREELNNQLNSTRTEIYELNRELSQQVNTITKLQDSDSSYSELVDSLKDKLSNARDKLETADERCRLLMRFSDPTDTSDPSQTQDLISANSIKILLIEEQNSKLRQQSLACSLNSGNRTELLVPTPLWHIQDLSTMKERYSRLSQEEGTLSNELTQSASYLADKEEKSRPKSLGRCGQLLEALSRARSYEDAETDHRLQKDNVTHVWSEGLDGTESNVIHKIGQIYTCDICDQMFHDQSSLISHGSHCH